MNGDAAAGSEDMSSALGYPDEDAIFTLCDGDYHLGLGALVNSLYAAGFRGVIYNAYRGPLPPWASTARAIENDHLYEVAQGCAIRFVKVDYVGHLTNFKPRFMLAAIERYCRKAVRFFYFDVDIVVKCAWSFMTHWVDCGIAVCEDVSEPRMSAGHPLRKYWTDFAAKVGFRCRAVEGYYNGGFVGLSAPQRSFLEVWKTLLAEMQASGISLHTFHTADRTDPFMAMDQDALNIALMVSTVPISPMDTGAMDITAGYVMSHVLSRAKPWRRSYLRDAVLGYPPGPANKNYWRYVREPIEVMSMWRKRRALLSLAAASAIGRFYRRG